MSPLLAGKKQNLCTPLGVRKAVISLYSKRPNENGQKSLYQSRNGFIIKDSIVRLKHFGNQVYNTLWCVELSFTFSFCKSEPLNVILTSSCVKAPNYSYTIKKHTSKVGFMSNFGGVVFCVILFF